MTYPAGTQGWLKYAGTDVWFPVEVLSRQSSSHTYELRRTRTVFTVGPRDLVIVITPAAA